MLATTLFNVIAVPAAPHEASAPAQSGVFIAWIVVGVVGLMVGAVLVRVSAHRLSGASVPALIAVELPRAATNEPSHAGASRTMEHSLDLSPDLVPAS
jgi:hypothetical protein